MEQSPQPIPPRRRQFHGRSVGTPTELEVMRRIARVSQKAMAKRAGISSFRASIVERDPLKAKPGEIEALSAAVLELAAERTGGTP